MLEKIPAAIGHALEGVRPGLDKLVEADRVLAALPLAIRLTSPAFADDAPMPARFTEDGAGVSPPLEWSGVPADAIELLLIVEDADPPLPRPLVHAIVHRLPPQDGGLAEGALSGADPAAAIGRNSFLHSAWLPPDPPTGHGEHRYVFQLFALRRAADLRDDPGRSAVREVAIDAAIARGRLIGRYGRAG